MHSNMINKIIIKCNTFTPQIKEIPEDTFSRETTKCTPVYIELYRRKVVALLKVQATFIKASMALVWVRFHKCFGMFLNADTPTLWTTQVN